MESYIWLIPLLPLAAFGFNFFFGKGRSEPLITVIAAGSVALSFLLSILVFLQVGSGTHLDWNLYTWIDSGNFDISIGFYVDEMAAIMLLVVTGVSLLVHIYSRGYMHGDPGYYRFFAYLPLFTFSMLMLVLANNFLQLYFFWEAVGLCSYLLIGFWYERPSASFAALKAFLVNRVGDFGFGLGIIFTFVTFGTLSYASVFERADTASTSVLTAITLLLFMGAMGKSAQWPLHVWLPDAMEGPTPVSALIHAATMVTAGVYMVARANPLFEAAQGTLTIVAVVGLVTALLGATIGIVQNDIKRVMAYSTISQLGYMFFALGIGAYVSAIFHLFTHAFFKALLFLGAGSVMHAMNGETDMQKMGGLRRYMPHTFATLTIGGLALAGVPPLAGFWSKDEILGTAFIDHKYWIYALGTLASFFTAFYITRLIALTFLGSPRFDEHEIHPHESPSVMTIPLWVLAVLSVVAGFVGVPPENGFIHSFLSGVFEHGEEAAHAGGFSAEVLVLMAVATLVAIAGILLALGVYYWQIPSLNPKVWGERLSFVYRLLWNKYYFDDLYDVWFVRSTKALGNAMWFVDSEGVDGAVNGVAKGVSTSSTLLRKIQTGFVGNYALMICIGMVLVVAYLFFQR